jgi:hypothetical protein
MTNQQHPIIPPSELVQRWRAAASNVPATLSTQTEPRCDYIDYIATAASQWGADQELEACCEWLKDFPHFIGIEEQLRATRRPKPPSLKEQALEALERQSIRSIPSLVSNNDCDTIRRALEQLDD